jgi:hypothetical protein
MLFDLTRSLVVKGLPKPPGKWAVISAANPPLSLQLGFTSKKKKREALEADAVCVGCLFLRTPSRVPD